ncbi:hypothetical protein CARUB_v10011629mg [Capsella rubella]|uniref:RRM domain-containing protein n=1 Tax=Capsella rubella TaxID=81985 RepID=R0IKG6_9BRAS|nr:hypothetical protein CARUB_v10011629mg [Capsella rubella]
MAEHATSEAVVNVPAAQFDSQVSEPFVVTLLVRHLPDGIPHDIVSRLFSQYGASAVRPCSGGKLRNAAFVDFKNEAFASQAHRQLNGLRFLGKVLQVQRANKPNENKKSRQIEESMIKGNAFSTVVANSDSKPEQMLSGEPIAPKLGINYPFPPHLQYAYPPPDDNILANITNALIAVPPLYTQISTIMVLHLMNKMNLPPPFRLALPRPPLSKTGPQPTDLENQSSSESEMESDEDTGTSKSGRKRARHENLVGPGMDKDVPHETVGVKPSSLTPKEIPRIRKNKHVMQIKITQKVAQDEDKEDNENENPEDEPREEDTNFKPFVSIEELEKGKLPSQDILSLPMFKNYTAGNPSVVLYIKNLAKDVAIDDFYYIFGSQFESMEAAKSSLGVRLMQNLVNGFVFKGKPMIIQFGRNPGAAKPNE